MEHANQSPCKLHQQRGPRFLIKKSSATGRPKKNGARVGLLRVSPCSNCISKGPAQRSSPKPTKSTQTTALPTPRRAKKEAKEARKQGRVTAEVSPSSKN